jgi:hypothetical protein
MTRELLKKYLVEQLIENILDEDYPTTWNPEVKAALDENSDVQSLYEFADATDSVGDLGKLNTYGLVKRDGQDAIVLIDYGLTGAVYSSYYA